MVEKENRYVVYCELLVKGLCTSSPNVKVEKITDDKGVLLTVFGISLGDIKRVIGKSGAHVGAIRELLRVAGAMEGARVAVKIAEPDGSLRVPRAPSPVHE